jgi:hypothetical protein
MRSSRHLRTLGGPMSAAISVSNDGAVIERGMQQLERELLDAGVTSVNGWTLITASAVSADATVVVGYGLNPTGQWEAIPAPR